MTTAVATSLPRRADAGGWPRLRQISLSVALFAWLYNVEFKALGPLTSGRFALLVLLVLHLRPLTVAWTAYARQHAIALVAYGCALLYAAVLTIGAGDTDQASRLFHFLLYSVLGAVLWTVIERGDAANFTRRFAAVTGLQAILILISLVSPGYRNWVAGILVQGGHIELTFSIRPPGFSNGGGAALSVVQAAGVFASLLAAEWTGSTRDRRWFQLSAVLCLLSTLVSGRTGLLAALAFFGLFVAVGPSHARTALMRYLLGLGAVVALLWPLLIGLLRSRLPELDQLTRWAFEFFVAGGETASVADLRSMPLPPLSNETIAGTGLITGRYGNASGSDSGYVQTYFALGLPMTVLFYVTFFGHGLGAAWRSRERLRLSLFLLVLIVIELKEPFVFKYALPFFLLALALLARDRRPDPGAV